MEYEDVDNAMFALARGAAFMIGNATEKNGMVALGPVIEIVRDFGELIKPEYRHLYENHLQALKEEAIEAQTRQNN